MATQIFSIFTPRETIHFDIYIYIFFKSLETTKLKIIGFVSYFVTLMISFFILDPCQVKNPMENFVESYSSCERNLPRGRKANRSVATSEVGVKSD